MEDELIEPTEKAEGYLARVAGGGRDENPYEERTDERRKWDAGWLEAEKGLAEDDPDFDTD